MRWQAVAILFLSLLMGSCNKLFISNLSKISLPDSLYTELKSYTDSHRVLLYSPSAPISSALLVRNQVYSQAFFRDFDQQDFMHRAMVYKRLPGDSLSILLCPKGMRFDQASLLPYALYQDFHAPKKMGLTNVVAPVAIGVAAAVGLSQGDLGSGLAGGLGILVFSAYQDLAGWAYGEMTNPNAYWNPNRVGPLLLARPDSVAADTLAIDTVRLPLPTLVPSLSHQTLSRIKKSQAWVRPQIWLATEYPLFSYRGVEMPLKGYGYPYRPSIHYSLGYSKSFREHWDWSIQVGLEHGLMRRYLYGPTPDKRGYQHASLASGPIWRKEGGTQHPWVFRLGLSAQLNYFMGWRSISEFDWLPVNARGVDDTLVNTPSQLKMDTYVLTFNTERASLLPRLDFSYERRMSPHSSLALSASLQHYSGQLEYRVYSQEWDFSQQGTVYTIKSSSGAEELVTRYGVFNMGIRYIYHLNIKK